MTPDPTSAPASAPEVPPAREPDAVPQSTDQIPDPAPDAAASPDAPRPLPAAPGDAAELRPTLQSILSDPRYKPVAGPAPNAGDISDADLKTIWNKYQAVPVAKEEEAFKLLLTEATNLALKRAKGETTRETAERTNRERAVAQATDLKTAISAQVQRVAPDVDLDLFWDWGARIAQQEAMQQRFPDNPAALDWQVRRAIQLVRGKLGTPAGRQSPAARGTRSGGPPAQRGRTMVDQLNAMQKKQLGGG
jgi:hypothetical protein